jgi:hypothetical protein
MSRMVSSLQENLKIPLSGLPFKRKEPTLKSFHLHTTLRKPIPFANVRRGEDHDSHAKHSLSLIEDPLWKHVCKEVIHIMGPSSALKIEGIQLGDLSPHDHEVLLYCPTEEIAQFIRQYSFIFLGNIQNYFPNVRNLNIEIL